MLPKVLAHISRMLVNLKEHCLVSSTAQPNLPLMKVIKSFYNIVNSIINNFIGLQK